MICSKSKCTRRTFMDTGRCFDHQGRQPGIGVAAFWFAFCAALSAVLIGVVLWAIIELVTWVTAQ